MMPPPLGLRPRFIVVEQRMDEIIDAIGRYKDAGMVIPREWTDEYDDLFQWYIKWRKEVNAQS